MDFVVDHAVPLSAIVLLALVLGGLLVLGIAGLRLWRRVRAAQRRVTAAGAELNAELARLTEAQARMPERQAELQAAIEALSRRASVLGVLAGSAGDAIAVLRAPLRYLGR